MTANQFQVQNDNNLNNLNMVLDRYSIIIIIIFLQVIDS